MSLILFLIGAAIFVALGVGHGLLTLLDLSNPRSFTPTETAVREAMTKAPLRFAPQTSIWRSWMGFNLSHSFGLLVFGGVLMGLAIDDFSAVRASSFLQALSVGVPLVYIVLAVRFWFWAPAVASALGCACFLGSALLG